MNWNNYLHAAILAHDILGIREALRFGADQNCANHAGESALIVAIIVKNEPIARLLVSAGANVNHLSWNDNQPLHFAAQLDWREGVNLLVDAGAKVNFPNMSGETPLHLAAASGNLTVVERLLELGAKRLLRDINGQTPEGRASLTSVKEVLQSYLAMPNSDDVSKDTIDTKQNFVTRLRSEFFRLAHSIRR